MDRGPQFLFDYGNADQIAAFNETRPSTATARQLASLSVPMDLNMFKFDDGTYMPRHMLDLPPEHSRDVYSRKYAEAKSLGLVDHILKHGIINPIRMVPNMGRLGGKYAAFMYNGQHRAAVMLRHRPDTPIALDWRTTDQFEDREENRLYNTKFPTIRNNGIGSEWA